MGKYCGQNLASVSTAFNVMDLSRLPLVSVIIPCYNAAAGLQDTLASLSAQNYPKDSWEIIVVDNNSTDQTAEVAQSFQPQFPKLSVLSEYTRQSSYAARNRGIDAARGEILAFIDADITVESDWLSQGVEDIVSGRGDYVGCRIHIYPTHTPPTIWELYDQRTGFHVQEYVEQKGYAPTAGLFVRRAVVDRVGMFDERLISGGDVEFGNRVRDAGFCLYYDYENVMRHPARSTLRAVWEKNVRVEHGKVDLRHLFPARYGAPLTWRTILAHAHPLFNIWWFIHPPDARRQQSLRPLVYDLNFTQRLQMLVVTNIVHYAQLYSQLRHCLEP